MTGKGTVFVIAGPSGVGKGTLIKAAVKGGRFHLSISATTRKPRPGEVDGREYRFLSDEQFDALVREQSFLEWKNVYLNRYGTLWSEVRKPVDDGINVILEIDVKGALEVKERLPDAVLVFIMPPSLEELYNRVKGRGDCSPEDLSERMRVAPWEIEQGEKRFDIIIENDDLEIATNELRNVLEGGSR